MQQTCGRVLTKYTRLHTTMPSFDVCAVVSSSPTHPQTEPSRMLVSRHECDQRFSRPTWPAFECEAGVQRAETVRHWLSSGTILMTVMCGSFLAQDRSVRNEANKHMTRRSDVTRIGQLLADWTTLVHQFLPPSTLVQGQRQDPCP